MKIRKEKITYLKKEFAFYAWSAEGKIKKLLAKNLLF